MHGSPTTKELKKKHSSRLVGGAETRSWAERTHGKAVAGGLGWARLWLAEWARQGGELQIGWFHIHMQINQEEQLGSETDHATQGSSMGK